MISDMAVRDLQLQRDSVGTNLGKLFSRLVQPFLHPVSPGQRGVAESSAASPTMLQIVETVEAMAPDTMPPLERNETHRWRRHPQLRGRDDTLSVSERHARHAAVRGLFNARSGDYEGARLAFAEAAREGSLDLTALPGFWSLPRAGLTAAVLAYEDAGRLRDSSALAAHLRTHLRPRPLAPLPASHGTRRQAATGN